MRVFVTGASGGIGSAVVPELIAHGHQVLGLARSEASARRITAAGATPISGELSDPDSLHAGAIQCDGVIHLAFSNDFTAFERSAADEAAALQTIGAALVGTGKPLIVASGTPAVPGRVATEQDPTPTDGPLAGRGRTAQAVLDLADRGVLPVAVRLPRSVHLGGRYGFASILIDAAQRTGVSGFVGDGSQRWPAVHGLDAARLFRLALEQAAPGTTVAHAVADEGDPMRTIAEVIGDRLGVPTEPIPAESFGFLGTVFGVDQPASSTLTREKFGWRPTHSSLLTDLATGDYPVWS